MALEKIQASALCYISVCFKLYQHIKVLALNIYIMAVFSFIEGALLTVRESILN